MGDLRIKELQVEFTCLRQEWVATDDRLERQHLLGRVVEILDECNCIVEQRVRERLARCERFAEACGDRTRHSNTSGPKLPA